MFQQKWHIQCIHTCKSYPPKLAGDFGDTTATYTQANTVHEDSITRKASWLVAAINTVECFNQLHKYCLFARAGRRDRAKKLPIPYLLHIAVSPAVQPCNCLYSFTLCRILHYIIYIDILDDRIWDRICGNGLFGEGYFFTLFLTTSASMLHQGTQLSAGTSRIRYGLLTISPNPRKKQQLCKKPCYHVMWPYYHVMWLTGRAS